MGCYFLQRGLKMKRQIIAIMAGLGASALMSACGTQPSGSPASSSSSTTPQHGGVAVYALPAQTSPNWFVPLIPTTADTVVNFQTDYMMYKPLVYDNKHDQFDAKHGLAQSIHWNKSGTVYTIKMNPKWHWSNGHPVTAKDVVFTWNLIKAASQAHSGYAWTFSGQGSGGIPKDWKSVVAANKDTVVITTTKPRNPQWFVRNGLLEIVPIPQSVWDRYPHNMAKELSFIKSVANSPTNPVYHVVDGAYRLASYQPNSHWTFVPNAHYNGHKSYLNKVVFQYETTSAAEFAALKTGTVNVGYVGASLLGAKSQLTNDTLWTPYHLGFDYIQLNLNSKAPGGIGKAFAQLPVRQALQMGVNQQGMISHVFHGYGVIDDGPLAPRPQTVFFPSALKTQPYPFNPTAAKKLLEKNGWHLVNGVMTKQGMPLSFTMDYASGSHTGTAMAELMKANWAQEGIVVHLVPQSFNTIVSYGQNNPTKWAVVDWSAGGAWTYGNDPYPTGGSLFATGAGINGAGYSSRTMDRLIRATYQPGTNQQTLSRLHAYEIYAAKQLPGVIYLPMEPKFLAHANTIHNTQKTLDTVGNIIHPNWWWITKP